MRALRNVLGMLRRRLYAYSCAILTCSGPMAANHSIRLHLLPAACVLVTLAPTSNRINDLDSKTVCMLGRVLECMKESRM